MDVQRPLAKSPDVATDLCYIGRRTAAIEASLPMGREQNMLIDAHAHLDRYGHALESNLQEIAKHRIFTISNSLDLPLYKRNF